MAERVGLFGGSFDPIHHGHLIVARCVAERLELDRMILLPSRQPPHKNAEGLAEAAHRAAMVRLAIAGEPVLECSDHDLACTGPSFTIQTIEHFQEALGPDAELYWLIGADSLAELHTWHRVADLVNACRVVTAVRAGAAISELFALRHLLDASTLRRLLTDIMPTPQLDISSTDIRHRVASGRSVRYFVPQSVSDYIREHRIYG